MRTIFTLAIILNFAAPAFAEGNYGQSYEDRSGQDSALRDAEAGTQAYVDTLIRREVQRRRSNAQTPRTSTANCGISFWSKAEALRLCPPATAMKAISDAGEIYYYCDCSENELPSANR